MALAASGLSELKTRAPRHNSIQKTFTLASARVSDKKQSKTERNEK